MSSEGSPSPKSGRMRTMTRRASSMLGISSRSLTPAPQSSHKDSSSASDTSFLRRSSIDHQSFDNPTGATSTPASSSLTAATSVPEHAMPIPIPESPARETADSEEVARLQGRIGAPRTSLYQAVAATNEMQSPSLQAAEAPIPESRQHARVPEASQMSGYIISDDDVSRDNQPTPEGSTQLLENYFTTITSEMVNFVSGDFHNTTNNNNQQITGSYNTENHNIINSYNDAVTGSVDGFSFINQRMAEMYAEKSQADKRRDENASPEQPSASHWSIRCCRTIRRTTVETWQYTALFAANYRTVTLPVAITVIMLPFVHLVHKRLRKPE